MNGKLYTTGEAATAAKVSRTTVQYWISTGKITAPKLRIRGKTAVRLWTEADVKRMRQLAETLKPGPAAEKSKR